MDATGTHVALEAGKTQQDSYAFYFQPVWLEALLKLKCRVATCSSTNSFMVTSKRGLEFPFSSAFGHLMVCKGRPLLTLAVAKRRDSVSSNTGSGAKRSKDPENAAAAATGVSAVDSHLGYLGMTTESYKELLMRKLVIDAQPMSAGNRLGEKLFADALMLPSIPASKMSDHFKARCKDVVEQPARALLTAWQMPSVYCAEEVLAADRAATTFNERPPGLAASRP